MRPQPGPQTQFAACETDWAFFASTPGSGKSFSICMELCRWHTLPGYTGVGMRSSYKDLVRGPTSLFGTLQTIGTKLGGRPRMAPHPGIEWRQYNSSVILLHGNSKRDSFDGLEIGLLALDEAAHFDLPLVQYVANSRLRSTSGVRPYLRGSVMPTADSWVHDLVKPWLRDGYASAEQSGVVRWFFYDDRDMPQIFDDWDVASEAARAIDKSLEPQSLSFIFAKTTDNAVLMNADPTYVGRLAKLTAHERERLLYGSWEARPSSSGMFDRSCWRVLDAPPVPKQVKRSIRGWDLAATKPSDANPDPDWTRGALIQVMQDDTIVVSDMVSTRDRPGPVDDLIRATVRADGPRVTQAFCRDPGGAGVRDEEHLRGVLKQVTGCGPVCFAPAANKVALAKEWSAKLSEGRMALVRAAWNGPFLAELDAFPGKSHDDQVDAVSYAYRELSSPSFVSTLVSRF